MSAAEQVDVGREPAGDSVSAGPPEVAGDKEPGPSHFRLDLSLAVRFSVVGLFVLAVFYTVYFLRPVLLPVMVAGLVSLILAPLVKGLEGIGVARWLGSAITVIGLVLMIGYGAFRLAGPATDWISDLPFLLDDARDELERLTSSVDRVSEAANRVEEMADGRDDSAGPTVAVDEPSFGERAISRGRAFAGSALLAVALLYFLLASGDLFLRKLVRVLPNLSERKRGVVVAQQLRRNLSRYFLTISCINAGLGVSVGLGMWLLDVPNPAVWGVMAGSLNFVPYLGSAVGVAVVTLVGTATFDGLLASIAPGLVYLALTGLEGMVVTPTLLGHGMRMNPVAILLSLTLWGWMWGIPGMLIAVPTLAAVKVFADAYPGLRVLSEFLGR